ncbi:MAG: hypothetical protein A4S08_00925 [Proteobacteria bacterium SG_bin4]|nr:MAG: hypothetical protein A4S08_00925 [Proteobacteria bacterium SG_bin4]
MKLNEVLWGDLRVLSEFRVSYPSLDAINQLLLKLRAEKDVYAVLLSPVNAQKNDFAVTGVVVVANGRSSAIDEFAQTLSASAIAPASENAKRKMVIDLTMKI